MTLRQAQDRPPAAARYRMPPLCLAITAGQFKVWFKAALTGDSIIYARGAALDQQRDVAVLARDWAAQGLVTLHNPKREDGEFAFTAIRTRPPMKPDKPAAPDPESDEGRVLRQLRLAAKMGLPCPTNLAIARAIFSVKGRAVGKEESERVRYLIKSKLVDAGHVSFEDQGPGLPRVCTIAATGWATARAERGGVR